MVLEAESMEARARAVGCPILDYDIEDGDIFRDDVFAAFDRAREIGPFFYSTAARGFWVFSDFELITEATKRPDIFSNNAVEVFLREEHLMPPMIPHMLDPPEHHKYRMALAPLFTPRVVAEFESIFRSLCIEYIDRLIPKSECDFIADFARPVPADFFLGLLGVPAEDRVELTDALLAATFTTASEDPTRQLRRDATDMVVKAVMDLIVAHRENPRDDVFSRLMQRTVDDRLLTDEELFRIGILLVNAGVETTGGALGYIFQHLASHPQDREAIVRSPELIPSAVEELLRFYPNANSGRIIKQDVNFGGCPLRKGDVVVINRIGANRAPDLIPDGGQVILDRVNNNHTTFGSGVHTCLGSHVARRELRITLEEWHKRIPVYSIADDHAPHHHVGSTTSLTSLKLKLGD